MAAVSTLSRTAFRPAAGIRLIGNETIKTLQVMWSHRAMLVPQVGFMAVWFWVIQFFVGGGRGYVAVHDDQIIRHVKGYVARRTATRLSEEYREPTSAEWTEFE
jgi:hypothetical protein